MTRLTVARIMCLLVGHDWVRAGGGVGRECCACGKQERW